MSDSPIRLFTQQFISAAAKLPGIEAHQYLAPSGRDIRPGQNIQKYARPSAVLIHIFPIKDRWHSLLIKRPEYPGVHSGQISFPGGKKEKKDKDPGQTALRESQEEIGWPNETVQSLLALSSLYIPPSNFLVYPFVLIQENLVKIIPDPREVSKVIIFDIEKELLANKIMEDIFGSTVGMQIRAPYIEIGGEKVWGATAMILSELKMILQKMEYFD